MPAASKRERCEIIDTKKAALLGTGIYLSYMSLPFAEPLDRNEKCVTILCEIIFDKNVKNLSILF